MPRPRRSTNPHVRPEHAAIGEVLRSARQRAGYSQQRLAQALHVTASAIAQWELGLRPLPDNRVLEIAFVLREERLLDEQRARGRGMQLRDVPFLLAAKAYERSRTLYKWWLREAARFCAHEGCSASTTPEGWTALCRILAATDHPNRTPALPDLKAARQRALQWMPLLMGTPEGARVPP